MSIALSRRAAGRGPRTDGAAGRAHASAHVRRVRRPAGSARAGHAAARGHRARPAAVHHPLGTARHRQDHPRADHRRYDARAFRRVQRRAGRHQGNPRGDGRRRTPAPRDRPAHDRVHRRDPPLQQGPAGRVSAPRRGRRHRPGRRDDRESLVRDQRGAAVALEGLRHARPDDGGDRRDRHARPARSRAGPRRRARDWWKTPR